MRSGDFFAPEQVAVIHLRPRISHVERFLDTGWRVARLMGLSGLKCVIHILSSIDKIEQ